MKASDFPFRKWMRAGRMAGLALACVVQSQSAAHAAYVVGGNDIVPRFTRDGASWITFIDLDHAIASDSLLTGWNVWAQDYAFTWPYSTAPRDLKLIVFRRDGAAFDVVGKSGMETVTDWNRAYHFDLASAIAAEAGDYIGWFYPAYNGVPGGVIAFDSGASDTAFLYGDEIVGRSPDLTSFAVEKRTYSINVEGIPAPGPVPEPGSLFLLGAGLLGVALARHGRRAGDGS